MPETTTVATARDCQPRHREWGGGGEGVGGDMRGVGDAVGEWVKKEVERGERRERCGRVKWQRGEKKVGREKGV